MPHYICYNSKRDSPATELKVCAVCVFSVDKKKSLLATLFLCSVARRQAIEQILTAIYISRHAKLIYSHWVYGCVYTEIIMPIYIQMLGIMI